MPNAVIPGAVSRDTTAPAAKPKKAPAHLRIKNALRHADEVADLQPADILMLMTALGHDEDDVMREFDEDKRRWPDDSDADVIRRIYGSRRAPLLNEEEDQPQPVEGTNANPEGAV